MKTTRRIRIAKRIIIMDFVLLIAVIAMLFATISMRQNKIAYKENYKSVSLNGEWYMVNVDSVYKVEMSNGHYTQKDMDGNLVGKGSYSMGERSINLDGKSYPVEYEDEFIDAEYIEKTSQLDNFMLTKRLVVNINGNPVYYLSTEEAAEDQVTENMLTNQYYERQGFFNPQGFAIDEDDTLVAYTGKEKEITVPFEATGIASNCFAKDYDRALNLKKVICPISVKNIESYAFAYSSVEVLELSDQVTQIDDDAFADSNLKEIHLPDHVESMGENIFGNIEGVKVYCTYGSDTYNYLKERNTHQQYEFITEN